MPCTIGILDTVKAALGKVMHSHFNGLFLSRNAIGGKHSSFMDGLAVCIVCHPQSGLVCGLQVIVYGINMQFITLCSAALR